MQSGFSQLLKAHDEALIGHAGTNQIVQTGPVVPAHLTAEN